MMKSFRKASKNSSRKRFLFIFVILSKQRDVDSIFLEYWRLDSFQSSEIN